MNNYSFYEEYFNGKNIFSYFQNNSFNKKTFLEMKSKKKVKKKKNIMTIIQMKMKNKYKTINQIPKIIMQIIIYTILINQKKLTLQKILGK